VVWFLRSNVARTSSRGESLPTTEFNAELCLGSDARPAAYSLLKQIERDEIAIKPLIYGRFPFSTKDLGWRYFRGIFATSFGEMTSALCKASVSDCILDAFARASSELAWMPTRQAPSEIIRLVLGTKTLEGQMTRLRQIAMAGLAAIAIGGVASSAYAEEFGTFENRLAGATIGLPLGALPPPGIYTGLETAYLGLVEGGGNNGKSVGNWCVTQNGQPGHACANLPAIAQAVPLLFVPGWNWFGANYSASIVQAFYLFSTCGGLASNGNCVGAFPIVSGGLVYTNTFFQPINLSWKLGSSGWFVATAFAFTVPDGTKWAGTPNPDYWTFEPSIAFSYLGNNWVGSANFFYDINTKSQGVCCSQNGTITSGNYLYGDLTALYKFGKWSIGPVGYFETQTTNDTGSGCSLISPATGVGLCGKVGKGAAGALLGYDFGPVDLQVWVTDQFVGQDTPAGKAALDVWTRIGFKIWGFEQPHPLVTKN
jgi:hypothetical protein